MITGKEDIFQTDPDLYRLAISQIQDYAIFFMDTEGYIRSWNLGAERLKGYEADEIIGKHFSIFYPEEDMESSKPLYELNVAVQDKRFEDEGWRVKKDGSRFWANVIITPIYKDNTHIGYLKISRDLTQRKVSEEVLKESKEKYKLLVDQAKDYGIFILDSKGRVATWNVGAERIIGYSSDEIIGKHFSVFHPKERIVSNYPEYELTMAVENGQYEDEGWRIRKDGTQFWANVIITALFRENKLIGFSKLTHDNSEKKKIEEERLKNQALDFKLNETININAELQRFAHIVAHDLKAPLRAISNYSDWVIQKIENNELEDAKSDLDRIVFNSKKMNELIEGILTYAKVGSTKLKKDKINTKKFIQGLPSAANLPANAELILTDTLPVIEYPEILLHQVFENLITNAIKYSDKKEIIVTVSCMEHELYWKFHVTDNGMGIEEKYFEKIFSIFETAGNVGEESIGIGLSIVKKAIELEGGTIKVESKVGSGSEFIFTILKPTLR